MSKGIRLRLLFFGGGLLLLISLLVLLVPSPAHNLFSSGFFMPHRHCYLDIPRMLWLQGFSDFCIGLAYMLISAALVYLVYKARKDIPFDWMFLAFGLFIFSCGWTHFMELWTLWRPIYWLSGVIKAITAVVSLATAFGLFPLLPHIFSLIETTKAADRHRHELNKAHQEMAVLNEKLEARVQERTVKLNETIAELEAFSYSLSHDMRAPLRAISGYAQIILDEHTSELSGETTNLLERMERASKHMDQLLTDVLAMTRINYAEVRIEPLDVEMLIREIVEERPELQEPRAEINVQSPLAQVMGDPTSLSQCLINLLSNAVKYVAAGIKPQIHIWNEERTPPGTLTPIVRLWVADNGIGIAPEAQKKIFEMFQRLHRLDQYEGTGIGLAIVRKAVERIGGHVGVESEPGKGSQFWLDLQKATPSLDTHAHRQQLTSSVKS